MIRSLAEYVMRGRQQAILMALLFSILPLFSWVADVIVALVALRKGAKEGLVVLLWSILPVLVLAWHYPEILLYRVLLGTVFIYLLALLLRKKNSWMTVLQIMCLVGFVAVSAIHIAEPTIADIWHKQLLANFNQIQTQFELSLDADKLKLVAHSFAKIATGVQVSFILIANLITLIFARWWQALLYNPGGLSTELKNIRITLPAIVTLAVLSLVALISENTITVDILPVAFLPFFIAGLSLLHAIISLTQASRFWLIVFYSLWLVLFPYISILLVAATLVDYGWNFRQRLHNKRI